MTVSHRMVVSYYICGRFLLGFEIYFCQHLIDCTMTNCPLHNNVHTLKRYDTNLNTFKHPLCLPLGFNATLKNIIQGHFLTACRSRSL